MTPARENFDLLCHAGQISGPADDVDIEHAEAELGVQFPEEYRDLLRTYGAVLASGVSVYGLPKAENNDPPLWQDVVAVTTQLREWEQVGTEHHSLIAISEDGFGNYFYLDTSRSPETRIWAVGPGVHKVFDTSLFKFLLELSEGKLAV